MDVFVTHSSCKRKQRSLFDDNKKLPKKVSFHFFIVPLNILLMHLFDKSK